MSNACRHTAAAAELWIRSVGVDAAHVQCAQCSLDLTRTHVGFGQEAVENCDVRHSQLHGSA